MQPRIVIPAGLVLAVLACTSDPTAPDRTDLRAGAVTTALAYHAVVLPAPVGGPSAAYDINDAGQVVGSSQGHPVVWTNGVMTDLGPVPGVTGLRSIGTAINSSGTVVGYTDLDTTGLQQRAFLWRAGTFTDVGIGKATDINRLNQVVGYTRDRAFRWVNGGRFDLFPGQATAVNRNGQIVGQSSAGHAVLWDRTIITDLGTLGGSRSGAEGINAKGQVVGWSDLPGDNVVHAFLWTNGVMRDLGTLGGDNSVARAVDSTGRVVGQSGTDTSSGRAFVWDNGVMSELPGLDGNHVDALAINASGDIVGISARSRNAPASFRAILWTQRSSGGPYDSWLARAPMPADRGDRVGMAAAMVPNAAGQSILYAIGGYSPSSPSGALPYVQAYNVATNTWSWRKSLPIPLKAISGAGVIDGKIYVAGGRRPSPSLESAALYVYDPATNSWARKRDMPLRASGGVGGVIGGKLYLATGGSFFRYDPSTDRWVTLPSPKLTYFAGSVLGNKLYLVEQYGEGVMRVYDPVTNRWTTKVPPTAVYLFRTVAAASAKLYLFGSVPSSYGQAVTLVYDPASNTWSTRTPAPSDETYSATRVMVNGKQRIELLGPDNLQYVP
jgi:probable HAF family extracellular repeat protein